MATYIIGDVHGCFESFRRLLERVGFEAGRDRVFFTGDLVNGGPASAEVLRWAMRHGAGAVLGNHDLHLLAVAAGARPPRRRDTFADVLEGGDSGELLEWLRNRPLLIEERDWLLVHAGLLPEWDVEEAGRLAREVEGALRDAGEEAGFFRGMYGDEPRIWRDDWGGMDRVRIVINAMTRMRMLGEDGGIDADYKGAVGDAPEGLRPWFTVRRRPLGKRLFFGHWAALGFYRDAMVTGLDSGCVWGGKLTAWRVDDGRVFSVVSEMA